MFRSRKLLNLARGAPCMLQIPDICNGDPATTVACHSNSMRHGHATGLKGHDCYIAFGCSDCHRSIDSGPFSRSDRDYFFDRGRDRTLLWLWENGKIDVCDTAGSTKTRKK